MLSCSAYIQSMTLANCGVLRNIMLDWTRTPQPLSGRFHKRGAQPSPGNTWPPPVCQRMLDISQAATARPVTRGLFHCLIQANRIAQPCLRRSGVSRQLSSPSICR